MKALIVYAHPEPRSFNGQLKDTIYETLAGQGAGVAISDLYALGFNPVEAAEHFSDRKRSDVFDVQTEQRHAFERNITSPDVAEEIVKLEDADLVVFQFPIWWFSMPAILKGWLDRVFVYGLFTSKERYDAGHFRGKRAVVSVTAGGPESTFDHNGRNGDLDLILWPLHFTLHYMGYTVLPPFAAFGIAAAIRYDDGSADAQRLETYKAGLQRHLLTLEKQPPLKFNGWEDWDDNGRLRPEAASYSAFMRHTR
ncbi:NAD(P)H-dependent oxidoreductase (plasmid) [Rhizobium bangladeshense]|uniref:NAD(P)H-dependent oxidoreductase n=1 Tax=Rhizobium bangladeshense TaxID=1138189 RepID=UPI001A98E6EB|nr:NAD(P)H-dependent oxidoreductase [Rhizobium bangladeshense]QSY97848.1 NAD(P)H-dependent oxidoreductase [Rhizobium bangladeshense]